MRPYKIEEGGAGRAGRVPVGQAGLRLVAVPDMPGAGAGSIRNGCGVRQQVTRATLVGIVCAHDCHHTTDPQPSVVREEQSV